MQETSMQDVLKSKISAFDLKARNLTWVLLKKSVTIHHRVKLNEQIKIETYPSGFVNKFAYRDFKCWDQNQKMIATASSCWGLLDYEIKHLIKFPEDILKLKSPDLDFLARPTFRIKNFQDGMSVMHYKINQYDLDWNNHLNNTQLIKIILSNKGDFKVNRFDILFHNEALLNDELEILVKAEDQKMTFKVWNNASQTLTALAQIE